MPEVSKKAAAVKFKWIKAEKDLPLSSSLVASCLIHFVILLTGSTVMPNHGNFPRNNLIPVSLVDIPRIENTEKSKLEPKPAPTPPSNREDRARQKPMAKREITELERTGHPPSRALKEEVQKTQTSPDLPQQPEPRATLYSVSRNEGGGSEAGGANLFGKGDIAVVPGSGTSGGVGGTTASGLGRGSGAPGLPAQTTILKTNREAKPMQTVRASYPPMALRMGMEGDVTIRIEVDTEGTVTKAEIIKGAGAGFDEEALKAVKQSRFEPAQKEGHNVLAEFTYIYRFRLAK